MLHNWFGLNQINRSAILKEHAAHKVPVDMGVKNPTNSGFPYETVVGPYHTNYLL